MFIVRSVRPNVVGSESWNFCPLVRIITLWRLKAKRRNSPPGVRVTCCTSPSWSVIRIFVRSLL
jgi:hypothetical protein